MEFKTAAVSLLTFRNGDGFNDPHWVLPSYTAAVLQRKADARGAPWIYNTWEPFERSINRDITLQLIDVAGAMGMDIFTIDDGWQQEYGENTVDPDCFSGGPRTHSESGGSERHAPWIMDSAGSHRAEDRRLCAPSGMGGTRSNGKAEDHLHHGRFQGGDVFGQPFSGCGGGRASTMPSSASTWPT